VSRFKGLGEMMAAQLKETTMDPSKRMLLKVMLAEKDTKATAKSVENLMAPKRNPASRLSRRTPNSPAMNCWTCESQLFPNPIHLTSAAKVVKVR